jgi:predicted dehydrogenase
MFDFLDFALGPISKVEGHAANQAGKYPAEDIVSAAFQFECGVHGTGLWCFSAHDSEDVTEIIGSKGTITYSTFNTNPVVVKTNAGTKEIPVVHPRHIQQPLIQKVVDALLEKGSCPSTGETAARTSWVMEQILKSAVQGNNR